MAQRVDQRIGGLLDAAPELLRLVKTMPIKALDIGARRGFSDDLLPLAPAVDAIGFEPDVQECALLNAAAADNHPWRSLQYLPIALGNDGAPGTLHLYRQRGCSSLLQANADLAAEFSRGDDYVLDATVPMTLRKLDDVAEEYGLRDATYLKIDVQGFEREIFDSGRRLLQSGLLAIRAELTMIPIYRGMPLAEDIMVYLRGLGFVPMGFEELHHWRRSTRVKHPRQSQGPVRFSRGQIMHGDMLFFRDSSLFLDDVEANLRLAFIAIAYGYLDHARDLMQRPAVRKWLLQHEISNLDGALGKVSCQHRRLFRRAKRKQSFEELLFGIRQLFS